MCVRDPCGFKLALGRTMVLHSRKSHGNWIVMYSFHFIWIPFPFHMDSFRLATRLLSISRRHASTSSNLCAKERWKAWKRRERWWVNRFISKPCSPDMGEEYLFARFLRFLGVANQGSSVGSKKLAFWTFFLNIKPKGNITTDRKITTFANDGLFHWRPSHVNHGPSTLHRSNHQASHQLMVHQQEV